MTDWQPKFLTSLRKSGNVSKAARAATITRDAAYKSKEADDAFALRWRDALDEAADTLEAEARRRAVTGTLRPVFQGGEQVGQIREFSDSLLIFLLKGAKPETYRERTTTEHTGKGGGPIQIREIVIERETAAVEEDS